MFGVGIGLFWFGSEAKRLFGKEMISPMPVASESIRSQTRACAMGDVNGIELHTEKNLIRCGGGTVRFPASVFAWL